MNRFHLTEVTGRSEKRLGLEAFHAGKTREAQKHFERATQRAPRYRSAWLNRMFLSLVSGDGKGAAVALENVRRNFS